MKAVKVVVAIVITAVLSGCIVVPGGYHGGRGYHGGGYPGGGGYYGGSYYRR